VKTFYEDQQLLEQMSEMIQYKPPSSTPSQKAAMVLFYSWMIADAALLMVKRF